MTHHITMLSLLRKIKKTLRKKLLHVRLFNNPPISKKKLMTIMDGHAYIHDDEISLFSRMAENTTGPIVEIGCAFGASSSVFLLNSKPGVKVHSIDPFVQDSMRAFQANELRCTKNVREVLSTYRKMTRYTDWTLHTDYSFNVVKTWKEDISMIFIDGDHNYNAVVKDFEDWYPHVKQGGYILFHDSRKEDGTPSDTFNRGWAGPTKFVNELRNSDKMSLVDEAFSITVWQKR